MHFHRRVPDFGSPFLWRRGDAAPRVEAVPSVWIGPLVFVFLFAVVGIYLFCTLKFGGMLSEFWLSTGFCGLSLHTLAKYANAFFIVLVVLGFSAGGVGRLLRNRRRLVVCIFTLALLGYTQVFLSRWKELALVDRERTQAHLDQQAETLHELRSRIRLLDEHSWGGEYVSRDGGEERRLLLVPGDEAYWAYVMRDHPNGTTLPADTPILALVRTELSVQYERLVLGDPRQRRRDDRLAVVTWGQRRYVVTEQALKEFLATTGEPSNADGVYLRLRDEELPLEGRPGVVQDLR